MKKIPLLVILTVCLAFIIRVYNINNNPPAVYGDELSFAWNAWNILKTGTDEYGQPYPLQFRAFDDYKAPVPVYLLVPVFAVFGMNVMSLRIPVAIVGSITVVILYFFVKEIFTNAYFGGQRDKTNIKKSQLLAVTSALLLAISPWHINLSRGYFESTLSLLPFLLGLLFFLKALNKPKLYTVSLIFFAVSLYTYFTPRIVLLILLPFLIFYFRKVLIKNVRKFILALIIFLLLCLPLVKMSIFDKGANRFSYFVSDRMEKAKLESTQDFVTSSAPFILNKILHNRYSIFVRYMVNDYLEQLSVNYWYTYGDSSLRYFLGKMGMFYIIEIPFFVIGTLALVIKKRKIAVFLFCWLLIIPVSGAISGKPYAVRSLLLIPVPLIVTGYGLLNFFDYLKKYPRVIENTIKYSVILLYFFSLGNYFFRYHFDYIKYGATWWGWENKSAVMLALKESEKYDHIFISNFYTGAELAFAFYTQYDPVQYRMIKANPVYLADNRQMFQFGKFYIGSLDMDKDRLAKNIIPSRSLYIGRPEEPDSEESIVAPDDGRILFKIYRIR